MICNECETVAHCLKNGCVPKNQALERMAENARELGLDYEQPAPVQQEPLDDHAEKEDVESLKRQLSLQTSMCIAYKKENEQLLAANKDCINHFDALKADYDALRAQQEPVAFPTRRAVEREIERTANPTGMHLNDGKERVALPGGTLRHMLALIDRTSPPTLSLAPAPEERKRQARSADTWVGMTDEERDELWYRFSYKELMTAIEAKLKEKNT